MKMKNYVDLKNGRYRNPILFADYSDPDVIRVGDTYYMTASSFNYTPGLPILISHDLVNWKLVNYALKNIKEERYFIPRHSEGVWAPSIRYHEGYYYIYYGMPDEGYYVVRAKNPLGEWEEPVCILEGKGLIDPCPFWDDDGKAYVIHGYAKSRIGFKSILGIFEMSNDGLRAISEDHFIFNGNDPKNPAVTIEGPKIYKRDGYYYILAPAGGVKYGYQVALRSKNICGPYEIKEVMHTGNTQINGPHQGGLVDTVNGDEWFIHFQDRGLYGRICHLQPVEWENGWPIIGVNPDADNIGEPVKEMEKPNTGIADEPCYLEASDDFVDGKYGLCWQWLGNHKDEFYGRVISSSKDNVAEKEAEADSEKHLCNGLRLYALNPSGEDNPVIWRNSNVLTQKIIYPLFKCDVALDATGLTPGDRTGVCMTGGQYITAYVEKGDLEDISIVVAQSFGGDNDKKEKEIYRKSFTLFCDENGISLEQGLKNLKFRMMFDCDEKVKSEELYFRSVDDKGVVPSLNIILVADEKEMDLKVKYTPSDHTWVGAKIGIYASTRKSIEERAYECGFSDFKYVHVEEL